MEPLNKPAITIDRAAELSGSTRARQFDICSQVSAMPSIAEVQAAATAFRVSVRTIFRWVSAGVNIADPQAVASHLLRLKRPSTAAMTAALEKLTEKTP